MTLTRPDLLPLFLKVLAQRGCTDCDETANLLLDIVFPPPPTEEQIIASDEYHPAIRMEMLARQTGIPRYANRDKIPQPLLALCDAYVIGCGKDADGNFIHEPTKSTRSMWILTLDEWKESHIKPEHVTAAWEHVRGPKGGYPIANPAALTKTILGIKAQGVVSKSIKSEQSIERTKQMLEEKEIKAVAMPDSARQAMRSILASKSVSTGRAK